MVIGRAINIYPTARPLPGDGPGKAAAPTGKGNFLGKPINEIINSPVDKINNKVAPFYSLLIIGFYCDITRRRAPAAPFITLLTNKKIKKINE